MAGFVYLSYIVFTMSSSILFGRATAGADTLQMLHTLGRMIWTARITVLLDLLQIVCAPILAVTLYRLSKGVNATLALLAMSFRVGEGLLGFLPLLSKLELMRLAMNPIDHDVDTHTYMTLAKEILRRPDDGFNAFCFVVGGFLFAYLLLPGSLIPRWLAWIGFITIGVQMIFVPLHIASIIPGFMVEWLWMAILMYEVPLGFWLIFKGVRPQERT